MAELFGIFKMTLTAIFRILNNSNSKFSNVHKRKQTSLLAKVNDRCFFLFPAAMLVPMYIGTNMSSHTNLYKFV